VEFNCLFLAVVPAEMFGIVKLSLYAVVTGELLSDI
jgi:hypothetical protein